MDPLKCVTIINLECKIRPQLININSDNPLFYLFSIERNKCNGSCNNINDPFEELSIPDIVNPLQDGPFAGWSRMGVGKKAPSLKSVTHILH